MKYIYITSGLILAIIILFVSVARANLETVMKEDKEGRIRVVPIEYITNKDNGEKIISTYYLPKIKIHPTNLLYPIKMWRDELWLDLTRDNCQKSKLLILMADKQMAEEDSISADEAVDKLILAHQLCESNDVQINQAAEAYRQITQKMRKYSQANEKIEKFIETEKTTAN